MTNMEAEIKRISEKIEIINQKIEDNKKALTASLRQQQVEINKIDFTKDFDLNETVVSMKNMSETNTIHNDRIKRLEEQKNLLEYLLNGAIAL